MRNGLLVNKDLKKNAGLGCSAVPASSPVPIGETRCLVCNL